MVVMQQHGESMSRHIAHFQFAWKWARRPCRSIRESCCGMAENFPRLLRHAFVVRCLPSPSFRSSFLFLSFSFLFLLLEKPLLGFPTHNKSNKNNNKHKNEDCLYPFSFLSFLLSSFFLLLSSFFSPFYSSLFKSFLAKNANHFYLFLRVYIDGGWVWRLEGFY